MYYQPVQHVLSELESEARRLQARMLQARSREQIVAYRAQSDALRRLAAEFRGDMRERDASDRRYVLITMIDYDPVATLHIGLPALQDAIDECNMEHRDRIRDCETVFQWHEIVLPSKELHDPDGSGPAPDRRHVFIAELHDELTASVHNTEADMEAAIEAFSEENEEAYSAGSAGIYYHEIVVPPRTAERPERALPGSP
ncbi:hypothetical protein [Sphingomonas sp. S2-65]|uniref:hypothetical protein n=1 Tax=Sphingomonas sp. S2-65 TaxID=2903960 RepID=UPI001F2E18F4|nr:hypothetical protein [Sphingomonas sp. S2-65]UYY57996.1 hypothetical protein LZ586_15230 [Sphingomonas sp. S2-65]